MNYEYSYMQLQTVFLESGNLAEGAGWQVKHSLSLLDMCQVHDVEWHIFPPEHETPLHDGWEGQ